MKFRGAKIGVAVIAATAVIAAASPADAKKKKRTRVSLETKSALFYGSRRNGGGFSDFGDTLRSGYELGAGISVDHDIGKGMVSLDASSTRIDYFSDKYRDRWANRVALGFSQSLSSDLSLSVRGAHATQLIGLEYDKFNQSDVRAMLAYEPGPSRFRVGAGYRWRRYDDAVHTEGDGVFVDADYRYRFGNGNYAMIDFGYDEINADVARRDYNRFTITPSYGFRLGDRTDLTLSSRWRTWTYDNRLVGNSKRKDSSIQPMIEVTQRFGKDWYVDAGAGYRWRWSNEPGADERGPRLQIAVRKRFRLN